MNRITQRTILVRTRKGIGLLLVFASVAPLYLLLSPDRGGLAATSTRAIAGAEHGVIVSGTGVILLLALLLTFTIPPHVLARILARGADLLRIIPDKTFLGLLGGVATSLGVAASSGIHGRLPRLLDEMAQLLHARAFAGGSLTLQIGDVPAARAIQNSVILPEGWVSIYPPGHTVLLALGVAFGMAWMVGPMLLGVTAVASYRVTALLYPRREALARLAGLLVAVSPFIVVLGSSYLSHVTVMAAGATALYLTLRSVQGTPWWALPAGSVAAFGVTARPWSGLLLGALLTAGIVFGSWWRDGRGIRWIAARMGLIALGGIPIGAAFLTYNTALFGSPFTLGYDLAFGAAHGLGLHTDPWGNAYGVREALAYTGTDLLTVGVKLFETPLPFITVVGAFLVGAPRLSPGSRVLLGWALLPTLGNALYWHHGQHFGPRMLMEAAPAFAILTAVALASLLEGNIDPGTAPRHGSHPTSRRTAFPIWCAGAAALIGVTVLLPGRLASYAWSDQARAASVPPVVDAPAVVFVHGSWPSRVGATLAEAGVRRDTIETILRRNDLCVAHRYAVARLTGSLLPEEISTNPLPGRPASLSPIDLGGATGYVDPSLPVPRTCAREARADRLGVTELAPLLWQSDAPNSENGIVFYRDLGPDRNEGVVRNLPETVTPWVLTPREPGATAQLIPYEAGMALLWGEPTGSQESG